MGLFDLVNKLGSHNQRFPVLSGVQFEYTETDYCAQQMFIQWPLTPFHMDQGRNDRTINIGGLAPNVTIVNVGSSPLEGKFMVVQ